MRWWFWILLGQWRQFSKWLQLFHKRYTLYLEISTKWRGRNSNRCDWLLDSWYHWHLDTTCVLFSSSSDGYLRRSNLYPISSYFTREQVNFFYSANRISNTVSLYIASCDSDFNCTNAYATTTVRNWPKGLPNAIGKEYFNKEDFGFSVFFSQESTFFFFNYSSILSSYRYFHSIISS